MPVEVVLEGPGINFIDQEFQSNLYCIVLGILHTIEQLLRLSN